MFGGERWDFPADDIFAKKLRHKNGRGGGIKMRDVDIKMEDVRHKKWEAGVPPEKRENCGLIVTFTDIFGEEY